MNRCPSEQTLRRYLNEQPHDAEPNEIDQHIESCPDCEAVLDRLLDDEAVGIPSWVKVQIQTRPGSPVVAPVPIRQAGGSASENGSIPSQPPSPDAPSPGADASRYKVFKEKEIGKGGIGVVYRAHDMTLNRVVAVKVLLEKHCGDEAERRRFLAEAELTGRLRHPGIVEVYDVGIFPDGRPYFAMKLISGQTLRELLTERPDPARELPRVLDIFERVCQVVGHAHAERVIHRDLKPANVMVGEFGEVQVMDWGMAKKLAPEGPARSEATERGETVRSVSSGGETDPNTVKGTPAYMAPEQARGGPVDERADVFSLGAILCEILTGKPPYDGKLAEELCPQAARANLAEAFARLDGCGADAALVGLAKRCLAAKKEGRPRDAEALARELRAYQVTITSQLRRRMQLALAATVLLLFAVGGVAAWEYHKVQTDEMVRREEARRTEEARKQREKDEPVQQRVTVAKRQREQDGPTSPFYRRALDSAEEAYKQAQASGASPAATGEAKQLRDELQRELNEREDSRKRRGPFVPLVSGRLAEEWLRNPSTVSDRQRERLDALERKLPYVLSGDVPLGNAWEQLDFAVLCGQYKRYYALAVHFYLNAFADPKLEWYKAHQHRYGAARAAILAASGQGEDARDLPDEVTTKFRRHALSWLRADLKYYSEQLKKQSNARDEQNARQFVWNKLERWRKDPDLASVRDEQALGLLPAADRAPWCQFWADVNDLRDKTKDQPAGKGGNGEVPPAKLTRSYDLF